MTTVATIAASAFDAVAAAITDAVKSCTLSDGITNYTGRAVFGGEMAPKGWPIAKSADKVRPIYLEGFSTGPSVGWTATVGADVFYVVGDIDIVEAGTFFVANVIADEDLMWKSATIETMSQTTDGAGGYTETWSTLATPTVGLMALTGGERWASQRVEELATYRAVFPYVAGLTAADRIDIDGVDYTITFIDDSELRALWHVVDLRRGAAT